MASLDPETSLIVRDESTPWPDPVARNAPIFIDAWAYAETSSRRRRRHGTIETNRIFQPFARRLLLMGGRSLKRVRLERGVLGNWHEIDGLKSIMKHCTGVDHHDRLLLTMMVQAFTSGE